MCWKFFDTKIQNPQGVAALCYGSHQSSVRKLVWWQKKKKKKRLKKEESDGKTRKSQQHNIHTRLSLKFNSRIQITSGTGVTLEFGCISQGSPSEVSCPCMARMSCMHNSTAQHTHTTRTAVSLIRVQTCCSPLRQAAATATAGCPSVASTAPQSRRPTLRHSPPLRVHGTMFPSLLPTESAPASSLLVLPSCFRIQPSLLLSRTPSAHIACAHFCLHAPNGVSIFRNLPKIFDVCISPRAC
jgi:hypothetical protein